MFSRTHKHPPVYQPPMKRLRKSAPMIALAFWAIFFAGAGLVLLASRDNALPW